MTATLLTGRRTALPGSWPEPLLPSTLAALGLATPYLATDLGTVRARHAALRAELPDVACHYAMKCNPNEEILTTLAADGASFEIASAGELDLLQRLGVEPSTLLYSNTVKPPAHVEAAWRAGVWRFAFDGPNELEKLARYAPGSAVYLRLRVDDDSSVFPLSRKFGAEAGDARRLLLLAKRLGLHPYGLTFHVGSQCVDPGAWRAAIARCSAILADLAEHGMPLEMLDLGGGLPGRYGTTVPGLDAIAAVIRESLAALDYRPPLVVMEPGRFLAAESGVMVAAVIGRERRGDRDWLHLDVGAYNGLMEAQQTGGHWPFPLWTSRADHGAAPTLRYTVTGPSCDSTDTMFNAVDLPASLEVGDLVFIGSAGAYTLSYASHFNGFAPPDSYVLGR